MKITFKKIFGTIFVLILLVGIAVGVGAGLLIKKAYEGLPDVEKLVEDYTPAIPTTIYDVNGEVIDLIYREIRDEVEISETPDYVKDSFVAIEDKRFYSHYGIDPIRLTKSVLVNISSGRKAQGGSTLTQQLARNAFLTLEKRWIRKVKEALISIEIEKKYTKDEILQKYMNEIYFGSGAYGIKTAARSYFDKEVYELDLAEAAMLAGIPNRPSLYDPRRNLDKALYRKNLILNMMERNNFITGAERVKARTQKFILEDDLPENYIKEEGVSVIYNRRSRKSLKTPDFTDIVEKKIFDMYDENLVYEGGLKVYTTLDLKMQKAAQETFKEYKPFIDNEELEGSLITLDASTGQVKSIIGGKDFKDGNFNRATMSQRQPGSAIKPFLYFTALRQGYPMTHIVEDSEIEFGEWKPQNYGKKFRKNFTILEGMERSINIVAIKLLKDLGIKSMQKTISDTGIDMEIPYNLTSALGTMVTSPYELSRAYLPLANGGYKVDKPIFITKIEDRYGKVIYENDSKREKVFEGEDVSLIVHMLKNVVKNGSGRRARVKDEDGEYIDQGGKTGTTNEMRSAWFAGITPELVTVLYVGFDDNRPMEDLRATGGSMAAPLWGAYYQKMIDEGAYTPGKFNFIEDYKKNGVLIEKDIDSRTGLLSDGSETYKRTALFKREDLPVEKTGKYKKGLDKFFNEETMIIESLSDEELKNIEAEKELRETDSVFGDLFDSE